jgi:CRP-like cAMP-binding protein
MYGTGLNFSLPKPQKSQQLQPKRRRAMVKDGNQLLALLSRADRRLLEPSLVAMSLPLRMTLERPNKEVEGVYFPASGVVSVVASQFKRQIEIGVIGREGMTGLPVLLGNHRSPNTTYMVVAGDGHRIPARELSAAMAASPSLRNLLLRYVQAFAVQTTHTAICNAHVTLDKRLARWLLMAQDRIGDDLLPLTHEFLSLILAVRRPGVTEALAALKKLGLVSNARGQIRVNNRRGLERAAGECYGTPEAEYRRLMV